MTIVNPYQKGKVQVSRNQNFVRVAGYRQIRTKKGTLIVSSQRDKKGDAIDPLTICTVKAVNVFGRCLMSGLVNNPQTDKPEQITEQNPISLFGISGSELLRYDGRHITVCLGADRRLIPLNKGTKTQKIVVRTDLIGNDSDELGGYRMLYRVGSEKTPAVKIYWTTQ